MRRLEIARGCRDLVDVFQLPKPTQARSGGLRFHLPSSIDPSVLLLRQRVDGQAGHLDARIHHRLRELRHGASMALATPFNEPNKGSLYPCSLVPRNSKTEKQATLP